VSEQERLRPSVDSGSPPHDVRLRTELARRELARRDYGRYASYAFPGWIDAAHHRLLAEKLQQVERYVATGGEAGIGRLLIFMPPRHGKSLNASVLFPTWFLGRNPDKRVIIASYNGALAMDFSRQARNLMYGERYRAVFGDLSSREEIVEISGDSRSVESWSLDGHKGGMVAAGVGGGITGKGAHLFIVDDPHKDRADAESKAKREAVWGWWTSTAYTRLEEHAAVIGMLTRWHNDDWAGRLIKAMATDPSADRWEVLCLPAIAESWAEEVDPEQAQRAMRAGWVMAADALGRAPGEPLWADKYDDVEMARIKANVGGYDWAALFQQRPRREEGNILKPSLFRYIDADEVPAEVRPVRYHDLSVGRSSRAHPLANALCGRDKQRRFYILDVREFQPPWSEARNKLVNVMLEDGPEVKQGIEVAGQQDGYYQDFRDDPKLQLRSIVPVNPKAGGDKEARAQLWGTRAEDGLIYLVRGPWNDDFIEQCVNFPAEPNDMVDGVSGAWQMLPGFVSWEDIPVGTPVGSLFDPFNERAGGHVADVPLREGVTWPG